jgi:hypothetical protein
MPNCDHGIPFQGGARESIRRIAQIGMAMGETLAGLLAWGLQDCARCGTDRAIPLGSYLPTLVRSPYVEDLSIKSIANIGD